MSPPSAATRLLTRKMVCRLLALGLFTAAVVGAGWLPRGNAFQAGGKERPRIPCPDIDSGDDWLNTANPLKLENLRGRIVVLDFWTLCCINCIHTLPDLAKLEAKYPGMLVVIGIHSPKFEHEKKTEAVRQAILKYQVKHPVINDADHKLWKRFRVNHWPTLIVIDPDGNITARGSGEGHLEAMDHIVAELIKEYRPKKLLKEAPLDFKLVKPAERTALFFPGKVLADAPGNRLFIADSTHHRVVITTLGGKKIAVAGTGEDGLRDGAFDQAKFSDPQGMTLIGETLYVADRKNHAIRALDLKKRTVKTVAGTGEQDRRVRFTGGPALKVGLNSPWDLLTFNGRIYIAMAGDHQIWIFSPKNGTIGPFAGTGLEEIVDGPLNRCAFAQPSGLATDGKSLFVADSETSSIRTLPLSGKGFVASIVGEGLFEYGDRNGVGKEARLQHPLAVVYRDGLLYVADTYNHKIKVIDPKTRSCTTFTGRGEDWTGRVFDEPGGLSLAGDKLYVADTNNHRIRVVDLRTRTVRTVELSGVETPRIPPASRPRG